MNWTHFAVLAVAFVVGFWAAKKMPALFSKVPGAGAVGL